MTSATLPGAGRPIAGTEAGRIVIADDDADVRRLLRRMLEPAGYDVEEFGTAQRALEHILADPPDLVFLDIRLPDRSGHEVLEEIRAHPAARLLPVVMVTGYATTAEKIRAYREGVTDFLPKPFALEELLPRVRALTALKQFADEHEHSEKVILTLARLIDARDPRTAGHSGRVAEMADAIAARLGIDAAARRDMRRGALFLDIGKIVIPDVILHKPGALTPAERDVIEEHPTTGFELLEEMRTLRRSLPIVRSHHERLDGSGYPDRLSGDEIPLAVRIVTVADIYDALVNDRSYREALPRATALEILREGVGRGWWEGEAVKALSKILDSGEHDDPAI